MRNESIQKTKVRIVLAGDELEIYGYEDPLYFNFSADRRVVKARDLSNPFENRERSRHRSHKMIRGIVDANFGMHFDGFGRPYISKFLTLTYAENMTQPTNADFTLFIKRLNYKLYKSKRSLLHYIAVIEFQKRGAVHYHIVIFNLPFMERDLYFSAFEECWGHGFVKIRTVPDKGVGRYITKNYITKADDFRLWGNKSYFTSRGLYRPIVIRQEIKAKNILAILPDEACRWGNVFADEHTGLTEYKSYNLKDFPEIKARILASLEKPATLKAIP